MYKATGMKRLTRIFVSTKDTRFQLQQDDDLTWTEFAEGQGGVRLRHQHPASLLGPLPPGRQLQPLHQIS